MGRSETGGSASGGAVVDDDEAPTATPPWRLRRQRSVRAAVVAAFAQFGGRGHHRQQPRSIRLGGKPGHYHYADGGEEEKEYFGYDASSAARHGAGGDVGLLRALWRRIARGRRKVMSRSGSSSVREQHYGQDEYEQNFDDGAAAAAEPEYLSRSFSARYAAGRRSAGPAPWGVAR